MSTVSSVAKLRIAAVEAKAGQSPRSSSIVHKIGQTLSGSRSTFNSHLPEPPIMQRLNVVVTTMPYLLPERECIALLRNPTHTPRRTPRKIRASGPGRWYTGSTTFPPEPCLFTRSAHETV